MALLAKFGIGKIVSHGGSHNTRYLLYMCFVWRTEKRAEICMQYEEMRKRRQQQQAEMHLPLRLRRLRRRMPKPQ